MTFKRISLALAASLVVAAPAFAQTKLKWAHVYEPSEPFHTASVWAAQEIQKRDVVATVAKKEADTERALALAALGLVHDRQVLLKPLAFGSQTGGEFAQFALSARKLPFQLFLRALGGGRAGEDPGGRDGSGGAECGVEGRGGGEGARGQRRVRTPARLPLLPRIQRRDRKSVV